MPEGPWRVFVLFQSRNGGGDSDYINPIDDESVKVLINAVYKPHFSHYKKDFGNTFAGFSLMSPGMGNTKGYLYDESIGRKKWRLMEPWKFQDF